MSIILSNVTRDIKLGALTSIPGDRAAIQKDLDRLDKWVKRMLTTFNEKSCVGLFLNGQYSR